MPPDEEMPADLAAALGSSPAPAPGAGQDGQGDVPGDLTQALSSAPDSGHPSPAAPPPPAPVSRNVQRLTRNAPAPGTAQAQTRGARPGPAAPLSWSDVGAGAVRNFLPSLKGQIEPYLPQNWGADVGAAVSLAKGLGAKTGAYRDPADEAMVEQLGHYYATKYGSEEGFKQALATDPASVLTDVAAAASIVAGGEGLATKVPGAAGKALTLATKGAGAVSRAANPIGLAATAARSFAPAARFSARAGFVVGKAFRSGELTAGDLAADGSASSAINAVVRRKGLTPASVREGVLRRFDDPAMSTPIPTQTVTGVAAPPEAAQAVNASIADWKGRVGAAAAGIGGGDASPTALGEALEQAQIGAHNTYVDAYGRVAAHTGTFDPQLASDLPTALSDGLKADNIPDIAKHPEFEQTRNAQTWLTNHVSDLAASGSLTPQALMDARKTLGWFWTQAKGSDEAGVSSLIDAFDNHVANAAVGGLYSGPNPTGVMADMRGAIGAYRGYRQAFFNRANPTHGTIATAMKNLIPDQLRDPASGYITTPAPEGAAQAAQAAITSKIVNPKTLAVGAGGQRLYQRLTELLGGETSPGAQALRDYLRQTVTRVGSDGAIAASPDQLLGFLKTPMGAVFTPEEQSTLKQVAEAQRMLTERPPLRSKAQSAVGSIMARGARGAAGALVGHIAGSFIPGLGEFAGPLAGYAAEQMLEPSLAKGATAKALSGAPRTGGLARAPFTLGAKLASTPQTALGAVAYNAAAPPADLGGQDPGTVDAMTRMIVSEAGNQPEVGQRAVAHVAMNQARAWGKSITDTINAPREFEGVDTGKAAAVDPNSRLYRHVRDNVVLPALQGKSEDPTGGKVHFINKALQLQKHRHMPKWAQGEGQQIGAHTFYADGGRVGFADGGKVDVGPLVDRLFTRVKSAKEASKQATKPILKVPDNTVASALKVAEGAI